MLTHLVCHHTLTYQFHFAQGDDPDGVWSNDELEISMIEM